MNKIGISGILVILTLSLVLIGCGNNMVGEAKKTTIKPQCNDRIDNDGDGYCDFLTSKTKCVDKSIPGDPDCVSLDDNKESADCTPTQEVCDNLDNDCDNLIDEGLTQQCGVSNIGECQYGTKTCSGGVWGACVGNIDPVNETCDGKDHDCDSVSGEGCDC
ncbi:hypothetical protein KY366_04635, partial [Candidatus Woesearchaeota archaeon]|nr:hypothetical protein [Candidatus Woesearchaeota archaeon]